MTDARVQLYVTIDKDGSEIRNMSRSDVFRLVLEKAMEEVEKNDRKTAREKKETSDLVKGNGYWDNFQMGKGEGLEVVGEISCLSGDGFFIKLIEPERVTQEEVDEEQGGQGRDNTV